LGPTIITITCKAQDGTSTKTYTVTVNRAPSTDAYLAFIKLSGTGVSPAFKPTTTAYTASVHNAVSSITVTPTTRDTNATVTVNAAGVTSGTASDAIPLSEGDNTITAMVTAQDGSTTKTYTIIVTRAVSPVNSFLPVGIAKTTGNQRSVEGDIKVREGLSPNGDGANDILTIDGITNYPDNKLSIMSRGGALIYEAKGYDNHTKFFDGHSSKTGKMQQAGTYFYSLDYKVDGVTKRKTGFIVLKW
jgi:gliding motility-associated-like protein